MIQPSPACSESGGVRTLRVPYAVPVRTSVRLLERAKGINHTIAARLHGRRCPGLPVLRPGTNEKILCTNIRFSLSHGPGGKRAIKAVVTRRGIPLVQKSIASFRARAQHCPRVSEHSARGEGREPRGRVLTVARGVPLLGVRQAL